jgi:tetratricopeptide (TPR) repeat protein
MKKQKKKIAEALPVSSPALTMVAPVLCAIILIAHFVASFFPHQRVWGINLLAYLPLYSRIILIAIAFSVFIPQIGQGIRDITRKPLLFLYAQFSGNKRYLWYAGLSLLAMGVFWLLRSRTYFLGDGLGLVSTIDGGGTLRMWSEPLEILLHLNLHKFLNLFFSADAQLTYQIGSILSGGIFVFLALLFSEYLGENAFEKIFVFSILATMGGIQLFFGYVENYSFAYISILAYIFLALRWLDKGGKLLFVALIFVLTSAFHLASFYLLPSLAYLLLLGKKGRINKKRILGLGIGLFLIAVLFLWYILKSKPGLIRIFVLPVEQKFAPGYTSFSWAHLLDILNESLLTSPVGIVLISIVLFMGWRKSDIKSSAAYFLLLVTGFQLLFHFIVDPGLGAARDWDLFSALSLGYTILGLWLFLKTAARFSAFKYIATILIFTSFFSTFPWIAVNVSPSKSLQRFRDIMDLDPKRSRSGHYFLAQYFDQKGMTEEVEKENRKQKEIYPELALLEEAVKYYNQGKLPEALDILKQALQVNPDLADIHYFLGKTYYRQGALDLAEKEYKKAEELNPEYIKAYIDLAKIYASKGNWEEAFKQYQRVLNLGVKDPEVFSDLGKIYLYRNQMDEALKQFTKALAIQPDFIDAHMGAGAVFFKQGRWDDALAEYQKVVQLKPDAEDAYLIMSEIYQKMGSKEKAIKILERFLEFSTDTQKSDEIKRAIESLKESP